MPPSMHLQSFLAGILCVHTSACFVAIVIIIIVKKSTAYKFHLLHLHIYPLHLPSIAEWSENWYKAVSGVPLYLSLEGWDTTSVTFFLEFTEMSFLADDDDKEV